MEEKKNKLRVGTKHVHGLPCVYDSNNVNPP